MYTILYEFIVKQGKEKEFIESWKSVTQLYIQHGNGLGSRLHLVGDQTYIAYAQWPNSDTRENATLPFEKEAIGEQMRATCNSIKVVYRMNVVEDLLI